jgi:hypothetical protein
LYFGILLLALIKDAFRIRLHLPSAPIREPQATHPLLLPTVLIGLLFLFTAQLWTLAFMANRQIVTPCWHNFPIPVLADLSEHSGGPAQVLPSFLLALIATVQVGLLFLLHKALSSSSINTYRYMLIGCACAASIASAVNAPVMTSPDVYYYMTYAKLGFASYADQPQAVTMKDVPITQWCQGRVLPSAYGPAFIAYAQALLARQHDPRTQIFTMRVMNTLWLLALLPLLRAAGASPVVVALTALNPVLFLQYVVNPHNDIFSSTLVIGGIVLAKKSPLAAAFAVTVAALVKLSFALIGALVFTQLSSVHARFIAAGSTFIASFALSYIFAGPAYFAGLRYYDRLLAPSADPLQYLIVAVALIAIVYALLYQRYNAIATYALPALRIQTLFPWYAIWSLPYAVREGKHLASFMILLPITAFLMETGVAYLSQLIVYAACAIILCTLLLRDIAAARQR